MQTSKPKKLSAASLDEFPLIIAATPATKQERRVALAIILILALVFIVIAPFASVRLPRVDAFVPALQTVLFFCRSDSPSRHYELFRGRYLDFERWQR
jgi:hypothetical protein